MKSFTKYYLGKQIKEDEKSRAWSTHGRDETYMRCTYKILVGEPQEKRPFGRSKYRWENFHKWCGISWWEKWLSAYEIRNLLHGVR
jgi:hypothetical protein